MYAYNHDNNFRSDYVIMEKRCMKYKHYNTPVQALGHISNLLLHLALGYVTSYGGVEGIVIIIIIISTTNYTTRRM